MCSINFPNPNMLIELLHLFNGLYRKSFPVPRMLHGYGLYHCVTARRHPHHTYATQEAACCACSHEPCNTNSADTCVAISSLTIVVVIVRIAQRTIAQLTGHQARSAAFGRPATKVAVPVASCPHYWQIVR